MTKTVSMHRNFVKQAMAAPYLTRDEEHNLALRWLNHKDEVALKKLCAAHLRLVIAVASKFRYRGLSESDLIQEGQLGLLEAASRFDPYREVRFSTYAKWWIHATIQDFVLRNWSIVRGGTSSAQKSLFFNLRKLRAQLESESASLSKDEIQREIADTLGVSPKDVEVMDTRLTSGDSSLNAPISEGEDNYAERQDFLVSDAPTQDETVETKLDSEKREALLNDALKTLNKRERSILSARRLSDECATLETLGIKHGISKERVRQIECNAMTKLKNFMSEDPDNLQLLTG